MPPRGDLGPPCRVVLPIYRRGLAGRFGSGAAGLAAPFPLGSPAGAEFGAGAGAGAGNLQDRHSVEPGAAGHLVLNGTLSRSREPDFLEHTEFRYLKLDPEVPPLVGAKEALALPQIPHLGQQAAQGPFEPPWVSRLSVRTLPVSR